MADRRTEVTELATALGMLGGSSMATATARRPPELHNVDDEVFARLGAALGDPTLGALADTAFANGAAFARAHDGLRGRRPVRIEWTGPRRPPGYDLLPADLRVDHVYLVSCKYRSRLLLNVSPAHLFDRLLQVRDGDGPVDWYDTVAAEAHQALYQATRRAIGAPLPETVRDLSRADRRLVASHCRRRWPDTVVPVYRQFCQAVSEATAARWSETVTRLRQPRELLWRLLRLADCPYFVLGSSDQRSLRLRVATPWDWRQRYELRQFVITPADAGQPQVTWAATVTDRRTRTDQVVTGHVEIRWSHGRFSGMPEAKVYLDTPHEQVPGYEPIDDTDAGSASPVTTGDAPHRVPAARPTPDGRYRARPVPTSVRTASRQPDPGDGASPAPATQGTFALWPTADPQIPADPRHPAAERSPASPRHADDRIPADRPRIEVP